MNQPPKQQYKGMRTNPYAWATSPLKTKREALGLTQRQAAEKLGLKDHTLIGRWERGVMLPTLINAYKLAALYDTRPDFLFPKLMQEILHETKGGTDQRSQ